MSSSSIINRHFYALVCLILLLALCLRLPLLNGSFWLDEAAQALESSRALSDQFRLAGDFQPPLYHLWLHLFTYFSHTEWWLRLSSLIPSLLTLYLTMLLARQYLGKTASLLTGLLLATSQFFVFYSQELRPYALSALFGMLSLYLLKAKSQTQKWPIALIVVNALGLLTVYTYILVILGQIAFVFTSSSINRKSYLVSLGLSFLVCLPWLPGFMVQFREGSLLKASLPGWNQIVSPPLLKTLPLLFQKFTIGRIPVPDSLSGLFIHGLVTLSVILLAVWGSRSKLKALAAYFWTIVISGLVLTFFIPLLDPKRLLFALPIFLILVIGGLLRFKKPLLPFLLLLLLNLTAIIAYWVVPDYQREPWRQAVSAVEQNANSQIPVLFAFTGPFAPWVWYQTESLPAISPGYLIGKTADDLDPKLLPLLNQKDVYVFDYLMDLTDPKRLIFQWLTQTGFEEVDFLQYPGIGKIRHFQKDHAFAQLPMR